MFETRSQAWREVGLLRQISPRVVKRARLEALLLLPLFVGVVVLYDNRVSLIGTAGHHGHPAALEPALETPVRAATVLALVTILQYFTGQDFGVDHLFYTPYFLWDTRFPGRMSPLTALCFMLMGTGISWGGTSLSGLIPICGWCKSIRSDHGYWQSVEQYVHAHTNATLSHGMCPDCARKFADSPLASA